MVRKAESPWRSLCPLNIALEQFGDRWSLLIVRDMMVRGHRTFKQFQHSGEGIASNILSDRLQRLQSLGLVTAETEENDARQINYRLTEKGIDLAPVLLELLIWGARHEKTGAPREVIAYFENNRRQIVAETRRRWKERDPEPLLPRFGESAMESLPAGKQRPKERKKQ